MHLPIRTAVAAVARREILQPLSFMLADAGVSLLAVARDGAEAVHSLKTERPDLLVADAELPVLDGASLIERAIGSCLLPVRPRAILLRYPEFSAPLCGEIERLGAVTVEKPLRPEVLSAAVHRLTAQTPVFPERELAFVDALLDDLGFPAHIGRNCLKYAALMGVRDESLLRHMGGRLIPIAADLCGISAVQAERAMRHAIAQAWRSDKFENQYRVFSDTVDAGRGQPTLSEMIFRLADILRLEG